MALPRANRPGAQPGHTCSPPLGDREGRHEHIEDAVAPGGDLEDRALSLDVGLSAQKTLGKAHGLLESRRPPARGQARRGLSEGERLGVSVQLL